MISTVTGLSIEHLSTLSIFSAKCKMAEFFILGKRSCIGKKGIDGGRFRSLLLLPVPAFCCAEVTARQYTKGIAGVFLLFSAASNLLVAVLWRSRARRRSCFFV